MKKILISGLLICAATLFSAKSDSLTLEVKPTKLSVNYIPDITYSQATSGFNPHKLELDLLKPEGKIKRPAVVFITGGGFIAAPKSNYLQQRMQIAEAGYVVASIEYRRVPDGVFPQPLEDIKSAIRYLRANADELGIDKNKIAVMGESAGGYFSAMTAVTNGERKYDVGKYLNESSEVQAAIDIYGLSDLTKVGDDFSEEVQRQHDSPAATEALMANGAIPFGGDGSTIKNSKKVNEVNPITHISSKTPPFLLLHGDKDTLVSPSQTEILHKALVAKGIDSTRYVVKNAAHGGNYWIQPEVMKVIIDFLNKNLK